MRALKCLFAMVILLACGQLRSDLVFAGREARLRVSDPSAELIVNSTLHNFCGTLQRGVSRANQLQGRSSILFSEGKIEESKTQGVFSGLYDPHATDVIRLLGNNSFSVMNGPLSSPIVISGPGNKLEGFAFFTENIVLVDSRTVVDISLISPLNRSVIMNGGTVELGVDLDLVQDATFIGRGTVDCKKNALRLNQRISIWDGDLFFKNAGMLQLRGSTLLNGTWTFLSDSFSSVIDGDNNILDISSGGSLSILPGNELVLINVVLRGLGNGKGSIVFGDANSTLTLIGCSLEMTTGYTISLGKVVIKDQDCLALVGESSLCFDGQSNLKLDGANFVYDALTASNLTGIKVDSDHLTVTRGSILARVQDANGPAVLFSYRSNVLLKSETLTQNRTMSFSLLGPEPVSLDGGGFVLRLPQHKRPVISIADGQTVVLKNIILEGFYPEHVSFGVGSKLILGDNTYVLLAGDAALTYELECAGNVTLSGGGNVLTLTRSGALKAAGDKTLRLTDIVIKGLSSNGGHIIHQNASAVVSCIDVDLHIDSNYTFSVGTLMFVGSQSQIITGPNTLTFSGTGKLVVDGVSLFYDTLVAPDTRNIRPWEPDGVSFIVLNGGKVRAISSFEKEGDMVLDLRANSMDKDQALSFNRRMIFRGQRAFGSVMELDGAGFAVQMPRSTSEVIMIPDGKQVTIKNLVLRDISPKHIKLGVGSSLIFGDGVLLQLSEDSVLDFAWRFGGRVVIDGRYKNLDLGSSANGGIIVEGGGYLRILNTNISGVNNQKIFVADDSSTLELMSSVLLLNGNCLMPSGSLVIANDVHLQGAHCCFSFASAGTFALKYGAHLYLDSDVSLLCSGVNDRPAQLLFEDATSCISLHNARLASGNSGLRLTKGTLIVSGTSILEGLGDTEAQALSVLDEFSVKVQVGATLDLVGSIVYE